MNKLVERLMYSFGINISYYNVGHEISLLKDNLPESFKGRMMVDVGCGDGKVSLKLKEILEPEDFEGYDLSPALVKATKRKGLWAMQLDVENQELSGDLAVLWGVLHHFKNPVKTLKKLHKKFNSLIIRESINDKRLFELGDRFNRERLMRILLAAGIPDDSYRIVESDKTKALIIFISKKNKGVARFEYKGCWQETSY